MKHARLGERNVPWWAPWLVLSGYSVSAALLYVLAWRYGIEAALLAMLAMLLSNGAVRVAADMRHTRRF